MKPHKHAELIKAWADGAEIEFRHPGNAQWKMTTAPLWDDVSEYRIKPQNTVRYARAGCEDTESIFPGRALSSTFWSVTKTVSDNVMATFSHEGVLLSVEMLK